MSVKIPKHAEINLEHNLLSVEHCAWGLVGFIPAVPRFGTKMV